MKKNSLYDCFLYNGEKAMLKFRLQELNDVVDKFIIVEGCYTFKGDKKQVSFNIEDFKEFANKIIFKECDVLPTNNPWANEKNQRDFLKQGFRNISIYENDIIILSDVDEIPDTDVLRKFKNTNFKGMTTFYHNFYYYNIHCRNVNKWPGSVVIDAGSFKQHFNFTFEHLRNVRHSLKLIGEPGNYNSGGWHFSYFGDVDYIINKIKSFSHQEYNNPKYTDPATIKKLIEDGKDLFFRDSEQYDVVQDQEYLPKTIKVLTNPNEKNKVFLDCGYHLGEGLSSFIQMLNISNENWEVHAFEANPFCEMSSKVTQHLPIQVIPHENAVWVENKKCYFNCENQKASSSPTVNSTNLKDGWGSAMTEISSAHTFEEQQLVEAIDFSQFVASFKGREIYCKMDIEGAEFKVLRKMLQDNTLRLIKHLWIEWHDCDLSTENIETRKQLLFELQQHTNVYEWH